MVAILSRGRWVNSACLIYIHGFTVNKLSNIDDPVWEIYINFEGPTGHTKAIRRHPSETYIWYIGTFWTSELSSGLS